MVDVVVPSEKFLLMLWTTANTTSWVPVSEHLRKPAWAKAREVVDYDRAADDLSEDLPTHAQPKHVPQVTPENFERIQFAKDITAFPAALSGESVGQYSCPGNRLKHKLSYLVRFDRVITANRRISLKAT